MERRQNFDPIAREFLITFDSRMECRSCQPRNQERKKFETRWQQPLNSNHSRRWPIIEPGRF